jgi:hypothetical protein
MRLALEDFSNHLRKLIKYDMCKEEKMHRVTVEKIRDIFWGYLKERKVEIL